MKGPFELLPNYTASSSTSGLLPARPIKTHGWVQTAAIFTRVELSDVRHWPAASVTSASQVHGMSHSDRGAWRLCQRSEDMVHTTAAEMDQQAPGMHGKCIGGCK